MKKYIFMSLVALLTLSFTSCKEDSGTKPGNDDKAVVTLYTYEVESPYNPDNDVAVRFVGNNQVEEIYFLVETRAEFDDNMAELGESGYIDYVLANGTKGEIIEEAKAALGDKTVEKVFTNLIGENVIAAVSKSPSGNKLNTTTFVGLEWVDVTDGFYQFGSGSVLGQVSGLTGTTAMLQHCTTTGKTDSYRLVDVFGSGFNMKFNILPDTEEDTEYGKVWYSRVALQPTSWSYGNYGTVYVRDIAYWQGNDAFATNGSYGCIMYEDGYALFPLNYLVSLGYIAYTTVNNCDIFIPSAYLESKENVALERSLK